MRLFSILWTIWTAAIHHMVYIYIHNASFFLCWLRSVFIWVILWYICGWLLKFCLRKCALNLKWLCVAYQREINVASLFVQYDRFKNIQKFQNWIIYECIQRPAKTFQMQFFSLNATLWGYRIRKFFKILWNLRSIFIKNFLWT